jgi:exo-beta-1,3-glucanase (GH17 family)
MYEDGQKPGDIISQEQVYKRIQIIKPYTKWVRSFFLSKEMSIFPIATQNGMKTLVGAWLGNDLELNEREIEGLIALAKEGYVTSRQLVMKFCIAMISLDQLLAYIKRVKDALPNIPVGYVDAYYEFSVHPELVKIRM